MSADDEIVDQSDDNSEEDIDRIIPSLAGENSKWYSRCLEYLRLGPARSVRAVYNREKGNERSKSVPASWSENMHRFEWQRRAEVYDAYRRAAVFKAGNASDVERVKKLDNIAEAMYQQLVKNIEHIAVNERFIERYIGILDLLARHTGGYAPQRVEHSGKDGKAIEVEGGITQQVVFYLPEVADLPEISDLPDDGEVHAVDGTVEQSDGPGQTH